MDDTSWVAGLNQPFILAAHPGKVFLVNRAGIVFSLSLDHATVIRRSLRKQALTGRGEISENARGCQNKEG